MNNSQKAFRLGQSIWYDNIERRLLKNGEMARMIEDGEIYGVTSNPSIFHNAIANSDDYDDDLLPLLETDKRAIEIFEALAVKDIQDACDLFADLYVETDGGDGYVSLEVNPDLAHETDATVIEAKRLWENVDRPNLRVKIPAPMAGKVDDRLAKIAAQGGAETDQAKMLMGKSAVANAKLAYQRFLRVFGGARFQKLAAEGGRFQRPLWASTSTKNPDYPDTLYVDALIGPDTVNTIPPKTLAAFLEHGEVAETVTNDLDAEQQVLEDLEALGISVEQVTDELEAEGVAAFSKSFAALLEAIDSRRE